MIQTLKYLILSCMIYSCGNISDDIIEGEYITKHVSQLEFFFSSPFYHFARGMKLDIKDDSTFRFETCGSIATGIWKIKQDSLILTPLTNKSRKDSVELRKSKFAYLIKPDGELHRIIYTFDKEKMLDRLVKAENNRKKQ